MKLLAPPVAPPAQVDAQLRTLGHAVVDRAGLLALTGADSAGLDVLLPAWDALPADQHLRDGGRYRSRRHGCFIVERGELQPVPHRAHWQPVEYNALHGGIERWFEPLDPAMAAHPAWRALVTGLAGRAQALHPHVTRWYVEAHPFRIDTAGGIGRPTPEGAHRDGVDLVTVTLVSRTGVKGGETRVFDADAPQGLRFTLSEPWTTLLLDDARMIHETTPIQPEGDGPEHHRDTLVLTFRQGGFQGPTT